MKNNLLATIYNLRPRHKESKAYHLIFLFALLFFLVPVISHAVCSSVPLTGDYTVSASCTFDTHSNFGGIDNGNITINSGQTLTVNNGQTIAWGPGKSLVINGSIAIADGGQITQGRLCRTDADGDGYVTTDAPTVSSTCTGKITQAEMNGSMTYWADVEYDYNDSDIAVYPGTACNGDCTVNDSTGDCVVVSAGENGLAACTRCNGSDLTHVNIDTLGDAEGSNGCAGTCAGYCSSGSCINTDTAAGTCTIATNARVTSGGDGYCDTSTCTSSCTANDGSCSADGDCCSGNCYRDIDGDSYAAATGDKICHAGASAGADCYDANANARPGQASYFSSHRGDGSYDYNCNGSQDKHSSTCAWCSSCSSSGTCSTSYKNDGCDDPMGGEDVVYNCTTLGKTCGSTADKRCKIYFFSNTSCPTTAFVYKDYNGTSGSDDSYCASSSSLNGINPTKGPYINSFTGDTCTCR